MVGSLYLIRHGRTESDAGPGPSPYKGRTDVPLSEEGERQIEATAELLKGLLIERGASISAIYCSTLGRAIKSAEIIGHALDIVPQEVQALDERDFGQWEGLTFDEIRRIEPDAFTAWANDPLGHKPTGGESTQEVMERVVPALDELLSAHSAEGVAVVAHGGVNRVALCHLLGMPLENIFRLEQDHAALSIVDFYDGAPVLRLMNQSPGRQASL